MEALQDAPATAGQPTEDPLLRIESLSAGYDESLILKGVTLEVPRNKVVALLGRNGVGKTTLLNATLGLVATGEGGIAFDGKPIDRLGSDARARVGIGYVRRGAMSSRRSRFGKISTSASVCRTRRRDWMRSSSFSQR